MSLYAIQKVYVSNLNTIVVRCPACSNTKIIPVTKLKGIKCTFKVVCICKEAFKVNIDYRRRYRKNISLLGKYKPLSDWCPSDWWGKMQLKNLSMTGVGFLVQGNHKISKNDKLLVNFILNDRHNSEIEKPVVVRNIEKNYIGCEFQALSPYEKALGFYLLV
ncbi:MAG: hypothetical protein A2511_11180 [Deltaproteobacteria bacterium RIFOXYD12_FULL_50_9]|nr:MAG: hypothetical protein A2328_01435 [Bdellovibrionales bacterium RIFOXYB2_FULL_36_6]OGR07096.1 MAG: hypothetical protein A2511_11180 [Deltaproteobacteria bacterium RIFOXYD12_FULL_50_9]